MSTNQQKVPVEARTYHVQVQLRAGERLRPVRWVLTLRQKRDIREIASCTCEQEGDRERERHTREDNTLVGLNAHQGCDDQ